MTAKPIQEAATAKLTLVSSAPTPTTRFDLTPATKAEGTASLTTCLILVAPSGMTADERSDWLHAARLALTGIPADLLERGCKVAREKCRFASEIVPTIMGEVKDAWDRRKREQAIAAARHENRHAPRLEQKPPEYVGAQAIADLIKSLPDGAA